MDARHRVVPAPRGTVILGNLSLTPGSPLMNALHFKAHGRGAWITRCATFAHWFGMLWYQTGLIAALCHSARLSAHASQKISACRDMEAGGREIT